jgi:hypothetical protein
MMLARVAALTLLATTAANAVVLCAKPRSDGSYNTTIKLREACKDTEMRLGPSALGLQGPPGPGAAIIRDANGVAVGTATSAESVLLFLPSLQPVLVGVNQKGFTPDTLEYFAAPGGDISGQKLDLVFEAAGCTGQPYLPLPATDGLAAFGIVDGNLLYIPTATVDMRQISSVRLSPRSGAGMTQTCHDFSTQLLVTTPTTFDLTTLGLVPPFRISQQ